MSVPATIPDMLADLYKRIADLERRLQNKKRTGIIHEVDAAKGLARVKLDEDDNGKPYLTGWLPWKMPAIGQTKINVPPSVGQQVDVVSESGDLTDALIDSSIRSDENPLPPAEPGQGRIVSGETEIFFSGEKIHLKSPIIVLEGTVHLGGEGGQLVHRKGDADSDGDTAVGSASKVYAI